MNCCQFKYPTEASTWTPRVQLVPLNPHITHTFTRTVGHTHRVYDALVKLVLVVSASLRPPLLSSPPFCPLVAISTKFTILDVKHIQTKTSKILTNIRSKKITNKKKVKAERTNVHGGSKIAKLTAEHFKEVPKSIKAKLTQIYKYDLKLFGYQNDIQD